MHVAHNGRIYFAHAAEVVGPGSDEVPLALTSEGIGPMRDVTPYFRDVTIVPFKQSGQ